MQKSGDLRKELRKICTTEAGVVKWRDFARVFQSFHPDVSTEAVSEIWTFLGGGEECPLHTFFRYCLPCEGVLALGIPSFRRRRNEEDGSRRPRGACVVQG